MMRFSETSSLNEVEENLSKCKVEADEREEMEEQEEVKEVTEETEEVGWRGPSHEDDAGSIRKSDR